MTTTNDFRWQISLSFVFFVANWRHFVSGHDLLPKASASSFNDVGCMARQSDIQIQVGLLQPNTQISFRPAIHDHKILTVCQKENVIFDARKNPYNVNYNM